MITGLHLETFLQNMKYLFSLTEIACFPVYSIHDLLQNGLLQKYKAMWRFLFPHYQRPPFSGLIKEKSMEKHHWDISLVSVTKIYSKLLPERQERSKLICTPARDFKNEQNDWLKKSPTQKGYLNKSSTRTRWNRIPQAE